jgi:hypothetical protein
VSRGSPRACRLRPRPRQLGGTGQRRGSADGTQAAAGHGKRFGQVGVGQQPAFDLIGFQARGDLAGGQGLRAQAAQLHLRCRRVDAGFVAGAVRR